MRDKGGGMKDEGGGVRDEKGEVREEVCDYEGGEMWCASQG